MIYNNDAELMYSIKGLKGLGDIPWSCSSFGLFCDAPSVQNANDNSVFGGSMTQANKDAATSMAAGIIAKDPSLQCDPSFLNLFNPLSTSCGNVALDAIKNPFGNISTSLIIIGVVIGGILILKH
jgi:hypothetical protein